MAIDKAVDSVQLDQKLTELAEAIRKKGNTSTALNFLQGDFKTAVDNIQTGGGGNFPRASDLSFGRDSASISIQPSPIVIYLTHQEEIVTVITNSGGMTSLVSDDPSVISVEPLSEKNKFKIKYLNFNQPLVNLKAFVNDTNEFKRSSIIATPKIEIENLESCSINTVATPNVTYLNNLIIVKPEIFKTIAQKISNNTAITNRTQIIYVDIPNTNIGIELRSTKDNYSKIAVVTKNYTYPAHILGFNHDTLSDPLAYNGVKTATGKVGISFQFNVYYEKNLSLDTRDNNANGWHGCTMRTDEIPKILADFSPDWRNALKKANKITSIGNGATSGLKTTEDFLWLASEGELYSDRMYSAEDEFAAMTQYNWYAVDDTDARRSLRKRVDEIDSYYGWARSPVAGSTRNFVELNSGAHNAYSPDANIISSAFCFGI